MVLPILIFVVELLSLKSGLFACLHLGCDLALVMDDSSNVHVGFPVDQTSTHDSEVEK